MMSTQQATFQDRLTRIQSGQGFTKSTVYVGLDTAFTYVPPGRHGTVGLSQVVNNAGYALSFPFCMALGFACHGLERYATYQLVGMPDPLANLDFEMLKMAVLAFAMTVVISHLMGMRERGLLLPKLLGVATGMLFFHNVVHLWPRLFEPVFSTMWVSWVTSSTEPSSLLWRGISFPF